MKDKVVIITGASSGIGRGLAIKYAQEGSKLVLAARRIGRLKEIEKQFPEVDIISIKTDVTIEDDCRELINAAVSKFGRIDILINNAGLAMRSLFEDVEIKVLKKVMDVNFWGTVYCSKYAVPYLLKSKGSLVGVNSIAGYVGLPGRTGYTASKFATRGLLETIRIENYKNRLHVLVAAPGFTATEVREASLNADGTPQGKSPRNENKMMSAEECARHIYKAIRKRKRTLILTFTEGKLTVFVGKIAPRILDKITFYYMSKEKNSPFK